MISLDHAPTEGVAVWIWVELSSFLASALSGGRILYPSASYLV